MPGVLQVEAMAQLGGLIMLTPEVGGSKESFFFGGVDACKFRRPVVPGDVLLMRVRKQKSRLGSAHWLLLQVDLLKLNKRFGVAKSASLLTNHSASTLTCLASVKAEGYIGNVLAVECEMTMILG